MDRTDLWPGSCGEPTVGDVWMFGLGKISWREVRNKGVSAERYSCLWIRRAVEKLNQGLAKVLDLIDHPTVTM